MTALSTLIHLSCILSPYETAFDAHGPFFERIITDAEVVLAARHQESYSPFENGPSIDGQRFTMGLGPIQPLFLTAWKYRHPLHRHRAIFLRSVDAGREGPWLGPREACITSRIMELEEKWKDRSTPIWPRVHSKQAADGAKEGTNSEADGSALSLQAPQGVDLDPQNSAITSGPGEVQQPRAQGVDITEAARINLVEMEMIEPPDGSRRRPSKWVIVRLGLCWDIEAMISYRCGHVPPCQDRDLDAKHLEGPCADNPHWEMWEETLEF